MLPTQKIEEMKDTLDELDVEQAMTYTLADAMREAVEVEQLYGGWVEGDKVCALSKAAMVARARHLID